MTWLLIALVVWLWVTGGAFIAAQYVSQPYTDKSEAVMVMLLWPLMLPWAQVSLICDHWARQRLKRKR